MSRPISVNKTINLYPTGINTSQSSYSTASNNANAQTDTDSTTYSTINLNTGSNVSSYVTYTFDITEDDIPDGATITAISCYIKARVSSTSYITTAVAQLYANTVAKGGTVSFRSNTTSPQPTEISNVGSWTLEELRTARIRYTATRGTSSTTRSASMNIYGTDLNITYTFNGMVYEVIASSRIQGYDISPTSEEIYGGESITFNVGGESDETLIVIDNGIDVTNQLVQIAASHSENLHATGYTDLTSGITINSSYPITNAYRNANTTTYARLDFSTSMTGYIELSFDIPDIPSSATITSLTAKAGLRVSSTSRMTSTNCQLYSGSTAKGSNITFGSTTTTIYNLNTGSWTASEVADLRMRIGATSSNSTSSKYIYLYGADNTINYELEGDFYTYTISNISADHVVTVGIPFEEKFFIKQTNSWNRVIKIYRKENGSWVEKSLTYLSDNNIHYLTQGEQIVPVETWELLYEYEGVHWYPDQNNDYPYCWIQELADVQITDGSVWRITYQDIPYRCTVSIVPDTYGNQIRVIGNPKWGYGIEYDNGTDIPFCFDNQGWGAWTGSLNVRNDEISQFPMKIERLVSS